MNEVMSDDFPSPGMNETKTYLDNELYYPESLSEPVKAYPLIEHQSADTNQEKRYYPMKA